VHRSSREDDRSDPIRRRRRCCGRLVGRFFSGGQRLVSNPGSPARRAGWHGQGRCEENPTPRSSVHTYENAEGVAAPSTTGCGSRWPPPLVRSSLLRRSLGCNEPACPAGGAATPADPRRACAPTPWPLAGSARRHGPPWLMRPRARACTYRTGVSPPVA
jgi:hypothetical protein